MRQLERRRGIERLCFLVATVVVMVTQSVVCVCVVILIF